MIRAFLTMLVFSSTVANACFAADDASTAYLLRERPSEESAIRELEFSGESDAMIEIDAVSVIGLGAPEAWESIHACVSECIKRTHQHQRIHVRFYHSDYRTTKPSIRVLHATAKRVLADLGIFVVMVDETVRNDHKPWSEYRLSMTRTSAQDADIQRDKPQPSRFINGQ